MTTWQWKVILSLCRVVVALHDKATSSEYTEIGCREEIETLNTAIERQTHSGHREKQREV